jgi:hypothetical protein
LTIATLGCIPFFDCNTPCDAILFVLNDDLCAGDYSGLRQMHLVRVAAHGLSNQADAMDMMLWLASSPDSPARQAMEDGQVFAGAMDYHAWRTATAVIEYARTHLDVPGCRAVAHLLSCKAVFHEALNAAQVCCCTLAVHSACGGHMFRQCRWDALMQFMCQRHSAGPSLNPHCV